MNARLYSLFPSRIVHKFSFKEIKYDTKSTLGWTHPNKNTKNNTKTLKNPYDSPPSKMYELISTKMS